MRTRNRFAFPLAATLTGTLLLSGCLTPADRETGAGAVAAPTALTQEEGFKILASMGYTEENIETVGTSFIVEGDMVFTPEALARVKGSPLSKTAQQASSAISNPKPNLLKVAIHSSMSDWAKFVHQAVNAWNAPNTRLRLEVVPIASSPNITIYSDASTSCPERLRNLPASVGGRADIATGGFPGPALCINKDQSRMAEVKIRILVLTHELGHTLGFEHTNTASGAQVPGTPASDILSLMNSEGNSTSHLSINDVKALEVLYPSDKMLGGTDLDGDRKDDIVYWRPSNGRWSYLRSSSGFTSSTSTSWGERGDMPLADMDLDWDGLDDRVVWNPPRFRVIQSTTGALRQIDLGISGDVPVVNHDFDGDGKDDLVVWRWTDSAFYIRTSSSNYNDITAYRWGDFGDIPVGGIDADQDGRDDFVVWRPSSRSFWARLSGSNFTLGSSYFIGGQMGDIPVGSTDLDRDGKDDFTTWRPLDGVWTAKTSSSGFASTVTYQWGLRGDVPIIGTDIDQDGKRDMVVWRPTNATWYVLKSNANFTTSSSFVWGQ